MARSGTFDPDARMNARVLFDQGKSCNAIAKELGVSPSTISRWAKAEGLSFDRNQTAAAVAAAETDSRARRKLIQHRLYKRVEFLQGRLEGDQFMTLVPSGGGAQETRTLGYVPPMDERNISSAITNYLSKAHELERMDDDGGVAAGESLLGALARELGLVKTGE